jgi:hypothetical protein
MLTVEPIVAILLYHVLWFLSGEPYSIAAIIAVGGFIAVGTLVVLVGQAAWRDQSVAVRGVVSVLGLGLAALGALFMFGRLDLDSRPAESVVGALAVAGGIYVFFAGLYLESDPYQGRPRDPQVGREARLLPASANARLIRYKDFTASGRALDRVIDIVGKNLSIVDLHYVAFFVDERCHFSMDVFEDDHLSGMFAGVSEDQRRDQYVHQGLRLNRLVEAYNAEFRGIDVGILLRVVLDVERGALYYFYVDDRRFLVGVTLDQRQVHEADTKMVNVVDEIRFLLGHKRLEDLNR